MKCSALNHSTGHTHARLPRQIWYLLLLNDEPDRDNILASNTYLFFQEVSSFVLCAFNVLELLVDQLSNNFDSFVYDRFLNFRIFQHSQRGRWESSFVS